MNYSTQTRYESYIESRPKFKDQNEQVIDCINIGLVDAWSISVNTNMLITSVRRALTNMRNDGLIEETGTTYHKGTNRNVTTYKIKENQLTLFVNK